MDALDGCLKCPPDCDDQRSTYNIRKSTIPLPDEQLPEMKDTAKVTGRRVLHFDSIADLRADLDQLELVENSPLGIGLSAKSSRIWLERPGFQSTALLILTHPGG